MPIRITPTRDIIHPVLCKDTRLFGDAVRTSLFISKRLAPNNRISSSETGAVLILTSPGSVSIIWADRPDAKPEVPFDSALPSTPNKVSRKP